MGKHSLPSAVSVATLQNRNKTSTVNFFMYLSIRSIFFLYQLVICRVMGGPEPNQEATGVRQRITQDTVPTRHRTHTPVTCTPTESLATPIHPSMLLDCGRKREATP